MAGEGEREGEGGDGSGAQSGPVHGHYREMQSLVRM